MKNMDYMIKCTGCGNCLPCPVEIRIPEVFRIYNQYLDGCIGKAGAAYACLEHPASECLRCGRCEKLCPEHIGISAMMLEIQEEMEEAFGEREET